MNPFIVEESQARYQARVDAAEQWRLAKSVRNPGPSIFDRLRATVGDRLIAWGTRVKAYAAPAEASQ